MSFGFFVVLLVIIFFVGRFLYKRKKTEDTYLADRNWKERKVGKSQAETKTHYITPEAPPKREPHPIMVRQRFFSDPEYKLYRCLYEIVKDYNGVDLIAKTRWEDIWNAKYGKTHLSYRGRLRSRHIDFVILNTNENRVSILIELNDSSHNTPKIRERDQRLREYCEDTGIHLLVVRNKNFFDQGYIKKHLDKCLSATDTTYCEC